MLNFNFLLKRKNLFKNYIKFNLEKNDLYYFKEKCVV